MSNKPTHKELEQRVKELETELKNKNSIEEMLKKSEGKLNNMFKFADYMVCIADLHKGYFTKISPAFTKHLGWSEEELLSKPILDFIYPDDIMKTADIIKEMMEKELDVIQFENRYKTKNGDFRWFEWSAKPIPAEGITYGAAYDITERKRVEGALRESQLFNETMLNASPDVIYVYDLIETKNVYSNEGIKKVLGYSVNELKEMNNQLLQKLMHPDDFQYYRENILPRYQSLPDGNFIKNEYRMKHKDGNWCWLLSKESIFIRQEDGSPKQIFGIISDISERKRVEEEREKLQAQLMQTQKMESIGTLAGGIAHDFNNMLGIITGNISYAMSNLTPDDELYEVLLDVQQGAKQAQTLTQQLLTFSKGGDPIKAASDINNILKESAEFITRGAKSKCKFEFSPDLWTAQVDKEQLNQVINNTVINAEQSMPSGGTITIRTENIRLTKDDITPLPQGKYIKICIEDQGVGISGKHIQKVFDPYYSTKQKGSGLGLSIVYSIIQRHSGHITVYSELDKGSVFNIYLPASSQQIGKVDDKKASSHLGQGIILIMDDQEPILKMLGRMLNLMGYEAQFSMDGSEAIEKYRDAFNNHKPFDLVILDLTVPGGVGGAKTIPELLNIDPKVKALVSSGYSTDPIMANYEDYGFCGVLPKPYTKEQLSEILKHIL